MGYKFHMDIDAGFIDTLTAEIEKVASDVNFAPRLGGCWQVVRAWEYGVLWATLRLKVSGDSTIEMSPLYPNLRPERGQGAGRCDVRFSLEPQANEEVRAYKIATVIQRSIMMMEEHERSRA